MLGSKENLQKYKEMQRELIIQKIECPDDNPSIEDLALYAFILEKLEERKTAEEIFEYINMETYTELARLKMMEIMAKSEGDASKVRKCEKISRSLEKSVLEALEEKKLYELLKSQRN